MPTIQAISALPQARIVRPLQRGIAIQPLLSAGRPRSRRAPIRNRLKILLIHIPKLSIQGQARLAAEVGVSRSTISRLAGGKTSPSYRLARRVADALERLLGHPLDMREVFSTDGTYPTRSGCALCRCGGCLPDEAYDAEGSLRPEWRGQRPGDWSLALPAGGIVSFCEREGR